MDAVLDRQSTQAAIEALKAELGADKVSDAAEELDRLGTSTLPSATRPAAVVYASSADDVTKVLRVANRMGLDVWPCSRGRNWGYGSATAVVNGSIILHLEHMNKIIEVNEELAYAVIEPGVSYRELRAHLERHHPNLWCDSTDGPPEGSVIGNALDRGLGVTHYSDHFGTLCGLEVVLPTGEVIQTGGGPEGCKTLHTHKWGVGPYLEGLFSQGNFGVVTKAGVWLMPRPEAFESFTFDLDRTSDLGRVVDILRELALKGILQSACHMINDIVTLSVLTQYPTTVGADQSRLPDEIVAQMRSRYGVAQWSLGGGIQGSRAQVRDVKAQLRKRLKPLGRLLFLNDSGVGGVETLLKLRQRQPLRPIIDKLVRSTTGKSPEMLEAAPHIHSVLKGRPSDYFVRHAYFKSQKPKPEFAHPDRDNVGLIWFAPIAPMTGAHVEAVLSLCRPLYLKFGFDMYCALLMQNPRSMIVLFSIFYRKESPNEVTQANALYQALSAATASAGYQPYRVGVGGMSKLIENSPAFFSLASRLKLAVDPKNILARGKYSMSGK